MLGLCQHLLHHLVRNHLIQILLRIESPLPELLSNNSQSYRVIALRGTKLHLSELQSSTCYIISVFMFVKIVLSLSVSLLAILVCVCVCVAAGMIYICRKKKTTQIPGQSAAQTIASATHTHSLSHSLSLSLTCCHLNLDLLSVSLLANTCP